MLRVLGAVSIDGERPIRSRAQRVLLGALAVDLGRLVRTDRLAELVWGEAQPDHPHAALQSHISRIRKILPSDCDVVSEADGYRLVCEPGGIDLADFDRAFDQACAGPPDERAAHVGAALELWQGEPFPDLDDERARAESARLTERHLALHDMEAEELLGSGRAREAVSVLTALASEAPLRERTTALLMTALQACGRRTEALDAYRSLRDAMVEQLGIEPSAEVQALEVDILNADASPPPPSPRPVARRSGVPAVASSFVGRSDAIDELVALLEAHRVVSIVGTGGVGKTRLAAEVAREHVPAAIPATWVELAPVDADGGLGELVADAFGLQPRAGVADVDRIADALADRPHLLVLDNCEHIVEAVRSFVHSAVEATSSLVVLVTSREPLHVPGEHVLRLAPFGTGDDAVALFVRRAKAAAPDRDLGSERDLIEEICARLDGLPLAIELAASRCATSSLTELLESLQEPSRLRARHRAPSPAERHGSLESLVDWTVRDLPADLAETFERVSVFAGGFTAADAAAVLEEDPGPIADDLADLADRSLLVASPPVRGPTRFRLLSTVRSYASQRRRSRGDVDSVAESHTRWVLSVVEAAHFDLPGAGGAEADARLLEALPDVRVVHHHLLETADAERSLRLVAPLRFQILARMRSELIEWILESVDRFGSESHPATENALAAAAMAAWMGGDVQRAARYGEQAGRFAATSPYDDAGMGAALALADVALFRGDNASAYAHFAEAARIADEVGDRLVFVSASSDAGSSAAYLGDVERARSSIAAARSASSPDAAPVLRAWVDYAEAEVLADEDPRRSLELLAEALDCAAEAGALFISGVGGLTRASVLLRTGRLEEATGAFLDLVRLWRSTGAWVQQWITLRAVAELLVERGADAAAALVIGAVRSSDATEISGLDAERLSRIAAETERRLPDAEILFARGATIDAEALVDEVIDALAELAAS